MSSTVDAIDALLPQTQCRQCGYGGCRPYAEAVAAGTAAINRCPPGGAEVIAELAALLDTAMLPLDDSLGAPGLPATAVIDEARCIGCTLCIVACPVDAIVGARRLMHTVITADCSGCALCLPPCPVDCITLQPTGAARDRSAQRRDAVRLREKYLARLRRLSVRKTRQRRTGPGGDASQVMSQKRETLDRALTRARARLAGKLAGR
ncbi:MAG: RnfABCDGE type electron transport complex subunit B [Burkholderiales bacterium]|nr:RnfABCDGE type electron transport complex subunit B [Burkholderiales bacterium]